MRETEEGETCPHATTKPPSPLRKWKLRFWPQNYQMPFNILLDTRLGISCWLSGKESTYQCRRPEFDPWVRKITWRRAWQPTPVFMPGESCVQRSLAGYSPWGCKKSDSTYWLNSKRHTFCGSYNLNGSCCVHPSAWLSLGPAECPAWAWGASYQQRLECGPEAPEDEFRELHKVPWWQETSS